MSQYFHFTLGPVQGFVAQARRTRDFWAGSFILSFLSAVAMKAVEKEGGEIQFPKANEKYLAWLERGERTDQYGPPQGGIPNRFKARFDGKLDPECIMKAVREAWRGLADLVWERDLAAVVGADSETRRIWNRQVENFWEITWAVTNEEGDSSILDRRKNWRSYQPPPEPGPKCMMMDGWQELSGVPTPNADDQNRFWNAVREQVRWGMDVREKEYLCAIAFIKRRFARHFVNLKIPMTGNWTLRGWKVPTTVPSVAYMAAVPWLAQVIRKVDEVFLWQFHDEAQKLGEHGEWFTDIRCVRDAVGGTRKRARRFHALDGDLFFESTLDNPNLCPDRTQAEKVKRALTNLRREANLGQPSPYYAMLLMDGDSLGRHMSDVNKQPKISQALETFINGEPNNGEEDVAEIVDRHSGFLVYAGGDDVLAVLPLGEALGCAADLRRHYKTCFEKEAIGSTLSGAILYAHIRVPLTRVLHEAHTLLDHVAKDGRGRDAIAVRVRNPGGSILEWAMPWDKALEEDGRVTVEVLAEEIRTGIQETLYASGFFYRIRERFELLNPQSQSARVLDPEQAVDLMTAEYLGSGIHEGRKPDLAEARAIVDRLLTQCRPVVRTFDAHGEPMTPEHWDISPSLEADGALLVRFLAREGID